MSNRQHGGTGETTARRTFIQRMSTTVMAAGLVCGYGLFTALIGRFLFPSRRGDSSWQFVIDLPSVRVGDSLNYVSPAGQRVVVTRLREHGAADDFIALSSICPHLGCQVHWESHNNQFFCPCHNGAFDATGNATEGPPKDAGQTLSRYPLRVENGLLFIGVDTEALVQS